MVSGVPAMDRSFREGRSHVTPVATIGAKDGDEGPRV
jgi:hypothetical protein